MTAFNATTRRYPTADRDSLSAIMDFDHPIRVDDDGAVYGTDGVYAPEVFHDETHDVTVDGLPASVSGWEALEGFTGQHGYRGAVMHASELIGGRLADDILSTPGVYVAVVVNVLPEADDEYPEPAGWAILRARA